MIRSNGAAEDVDGAFLDQFSRAVAQVATVQFDDEVYNPTAPADGVPTGWELSLGVRGGGDSSLAWWTSRNDRSVWIASVGGADRVEDVVARFVAERALLEPVAVVAAFERATSYLVDSLGRLLDERDEFTLLLEERTGERDEALRRVEALERQLEELRSTQRAKDPWLRRVVAGAIGSVVVATIGAGAALGSAHVAAEATRDAAVTASQTAMAEKVFDYKREIGALPRDVDQLMVVVEDDAARLIEACRDGE